MPTGYTHGVQTGEIETLEAFAMCCARAFGALVTMRDDSGDTPIPDKLEPSTDYHDENIKEARAVLNEVPGLSLEECNKRSFSEYEGCLAAHTSCEATRYDEKIRYEGMIEKVEDWNPSASLKGLKDFMLEQLRDSLKHDCGYKNEPPEMLAGEGWREAQLKKASRDVGYHTDERNKEIARVRERNKWLADLRNSLPKDSPQ